MTIIVTAAIVAALIVGHHFGHGHANYRQARASGHGRKPSLWLGARGAWVSVPGPFHTRIGHRL